MKFPIGIQNFESLQRDGYVYIDKTALIHKLVNDGRYYFLSRPRRFGKSLLISTIEAYMQGKKELFKGLALETLEKDWTAYPILHFDLNTENYDRVEALTSILNRNLVMWEDQYGSRPEEDTLPGRFSGIIRRACEQTGRPVVILVDEYDKPLLSAIGDEDLQNEYRKILKSFYSVMKSQDKYIKLGFLTGVTKFEKVSIFSDLNNLTDISMLPEYVEICGITEEELHNNFDEQVGLLAQANKMTKQECYDELKHYYDGYHFCPDSVGIYNPFSLLNALAHHVFRDYWFETGTPTFLVELLMQTDFDLNKLTEEEVSDDVINSKESMRVNPVPVLYQSGYLTISSYDREFMLYRLRFPNQEVEHGFIRYLLPLYAAVSSNSGASYISKLVGYVRRGAPREFMELLEEFFIDNDYRVVGKKELYFQNVLYVVFKMIGFYVQVERCLSRSRMDMILQTTDYIYIIEFKIDKSADEALQQIEEKLYARPFASDPRQLFKIGVNFSSATRDIQDWKVVE